MTGFDSSRHWRRLQINGLAERTNLQINGFAAGLHRNYFAESVISKADKD
jgi:hypothetical protein